MAVQLQNETSRMQYQKRRRMLRAKSNKYLSKEAVSRMGNVRYAHPHLAARAEEYIVQQGKIVSDAELKDILRRLQVNQPKKWQRQ